MGINNDLVIFIIYSVIQLIRSLCKTVFFSVQLCNAEAKYDHFASHPDVLSCLTASSNPSGFTKSL